MRSSSQGHRPGFVCMRRYCARLSVAALVCALPSCGCEDDGGAAPKARLLAIVQTNFANTFDQFIVDASTGPRTVNVPEGRSWTIQYDGSDDSGIRSLALEWDEVRNLGCPQDTVVAGAPTRVHATQAADRFDECEETRLKRTDFAAPGSNRRRFEYFLVVEDWEGHRTTAPLLTVVYKPC